LFIWLIHIVAWLERIFDRIDVIEKYLQAIAVSGELFEKPPSHLRLDTSGLNHDLPGLIG